MATSAAAAGLAPLQSLASTVNAIKRIDFLMIRTVRPSLTFLFDPIQPRFLDPILPFT
jgi:hypothetical protein